MSEAAVGDEAQAPARRASLLRRVSVTIQNAVLEDLDQAIKDDAAASGRVAPAPPMPKSSSTASSDLKLTVEKMSHFRHSVSTNVEGVVGALITSITIYPVFRLIVFVSTSLHIDQPFLAAVVACANVEVVATALLGYRSKAFMMRHLFMMWPVFLLLVVIVGLKVGGQLGFAGVPVAAICWALSIASSHFYNLFKRLPNESLLKTITEAFTLASVCAFLNLSPSLAVLLPAHYLSTNHPYWYVFISGVVFPVFIFAFKKSLLGFLMRHLQEKVEVGELTGDGVLMTYSSFSKAISVASMLASIVTM